MPCGTPFPYSAEEFTRKLLSVVDGGDGATLPKRFEQTFSVRLFGTMFDGDMHTGRIIKDGVRGCNWYANVDMSTIVNGKMGIAVQASLDSVANDRALDFVGGDNTCLTRELLKGMLGADGWTGGENVGFEYVIQRYVKSGKELYATPSGGVDGHPCIGNIRLVLKQSDQ
jgi:hypothetical protein